tara:strand:- start:588 stop:1859 length:1272 start_codon:yes stop_codon:yes gene_type:complete
MDYYKNIIYDNISRFDLIAKYLYIKAKDKKIQTDFFKKLYHKHLITFNGCYELPDTTQEKTNISKTNIDNFIMVFDKLIENIKENGYNEMYPIPIGSNGVIINGAHRLMISYYYNIIPKFVKLNELGNTGYNYQFFLNRRNKPKLEPLYADTMMLEYIKHNENMRCMIIYPVAFNMQIISEIFNIINDYGYIYYHKTIELNRNGINNLIKEVYRGETWIGGMFPNGWSPGGKADRCVINDEINPILYISICMNDVNKCIELKEKCRSLYNLGKHSLHTSDYSTDTYRITSSLLNSNSIHFLNNGTNDITESTKKLLKTYFENKIDDDYCLTSSLILEMYGLRNANDVDYFHKYDKKLDNFGLHSGEWLQYYKENKDSIIYNPFNYFYFNGLKLASLKVVKEMKEIRNENKDKIDLELIKKISI